jgi:hypothetical protein
LGNKEIIACLTQKDFAGLAALTRLRTSKVLRYLTGRLYSADEAAKWRAVLALGALAREPGVLRHAKLEELLRRYFWALNDESGTVPYGIPEAIGEILAARPEFQDEFLPVVCAMITHEEMIQTGPIERGVVWALGRVGPPVMNAAPKAVQGLAWMAANHTDDATRGLAAWALMQIGGKSEIEDWSSDDAGEDLPPGIDTLASSPE